MKREDLRNPEEPLMSETPILSAVDFSEASRAALVIAADLARRLGAPLSVLHVHEPLPLGGLSRAELGSTDAALVRRVEDLDAALRVATARRLRQETESAAMPVEARTRVGRAGDVIAAVAAETGARLVVIGTHGRRGPARWLLGSVAERTIRGAPCPVLVVPPPADRRSPWAPAKDHLSIAVGLDLGDPSPLSFVRSLSARVPCEVTVIHLFWPPAEMKRQGAPPPIDLEDPSDMIRRAEDDVRGELAAHALDGDVRIVVRPEWGRLADPLAREAKAANADLLVVGAQGSYSLAPLAGRARGVLHGIDMPVVFVPRPPVLEEHRELPAP